MPQFDFALDLPPGINSDDTTFAAKGQWADGSNVRFRGRPQVIGGWKRVFASTTLSGRAVGGWVGRGSPLGSTALGYIGTSISTKLYRINFSTSAVSDVTPAAPPSANWWSFAPFGSIMLACPRAGTIYEQDSTGTTAATAVANAPDSIMWILTTPERQVLAFGCNEEVSGTFNSMCIRGSDLEDYTDWTTTSTNNAFEHILDGGGSIQSARMVGTYVAVWTESALYLGQFEGNPGQTYRFDLVDRRCGLFAARAVTVFEGVAYWVTPDLRFMAWSPGGLPQEIPCPIAKHLRDNISLASGGGADCAYVTVDAVNREIWFHHPQGGQSTNPTHYVAFDLDGGTWFRGSIASGGLAVRTMMLDTMPLYGLNTNSGTGGASVSYTQLLGTTAAGKIYVHETGTTGEDDTLTWSIQSADQYLDNGRQRVMARGCRSDFEDQAGDVSLTAFVRDYPQGTAVTKGPFTLAAGADKKDFRASGKLMAIKFSGTAYARLGKPVFDCVTAGER